MLTDEQKAMIERVGELARFKYGVYSAATLVAAFISEKTAKLCVNKSVAHNECAAKRLLADKDIPAVIALAESQASRIDELEAAIRKHRDQRGDDRCWMDDRDLYGALPERAGNADLRQFEPDVMLANCKRYIASRHDPSQPYITEQTERIERLEKAIRVAWQSLDPASSGPVTPFGELITELRLALEGKP